MSLLNDILTSVTSEDTNLSSTFLKLQLLAARLGSEPLEEWVKHESEGFPQNVSVPDYRVLDVSYRGSFSDGFRTLENVAIPSQIIEQKAGKQWNIFEMRESITSFDNYPKDGAGEFQVNAANLLLLIRDDVYINMPAYSITGVIPKEAVNVLRHKVKSRIVSLLIEFEKKLPVSTEIETGSVITVDKAQTTTANNIFYSISGGNNVITTASDSAKATVNVVQGDKASLIQTLTEAGMNKADAEEFAQIVSEEEPDREKRSLGERALAWLGQRVANGADQAWNITTKQITAAALIYLGEAYPPGSGTASCGDRRPKMVQNIKCTDAVSGARA